MTYNSLTLGIVLLFVSLMVIKWCLTVVLLSVFLITSEAENKSFGMYFLFCELLVSIFYPFFYWILLNTIWFLKIFCYVCCQYLLCFYGLFLFLESFNKCIPILDFTKVRFSSLLFMLFLSCLKKTFLLSEVYDLLKTYNINFKLKGIKIQTSI